jgi:hypothetical protein
MPPSIPSPTFDRSTSASDLPDSKLTHPGHWRSRAEALRSLADDVKEPAALTMLLRMAADYDAIAAAEERRSDPS